MKKAGARVLTLDQVEGLKVTPPPLHAVVGSSSNSLTSKMKVGSADCQDHQNT